MRALNFNRIIVAFFAIALASCNDDLPMVNDDFIVAGDSQQNQLITFNDSICPGWQQHLNLLIDINNDRIPELEFIATHDAYQGGTMSMYKSKLRIYNQVEILVDTSLYSNYVEGKNVITPKILDKYDTINGDGNWFADTIVDLSYSIDKLDLENSGAQVGVSIFNGWNDLGNSYLGYRLLNESDTVYGWLELEIEHFNRVFVYKTAHR